MCVRLTIRNESEIGNGKIGVNALLALYETSLNIINAILALN